MALPLFEYERSVIIMNEKNTIINIYVEAMMDMTKELSNVASKLDDKPNINNGILATIDIINASLRSQLFVLQDVIDNYFKE